MSDDRDPTQEPPAPHEHHGVVETLREEIHEVVEHVPQPVRWTVGKLVRIALFVTLGLFVLAVVSTVLYLGNRTELVARELALVLNHQLAQRSDLVLEVPDIKGNPFTGFTVLEPRVKFRDGGTLLEARSLRVGYSAVGLLRGGRGPVDVTIDRAVVRLDLGPDTTWRLPKFTSSAPAGKKKNTGVDFRLHIRDARLTMPKPLRAVNGVELELSGRTGARTEVTLERMRWNEGPWHSRLEALTANVSADADSVRFRVKELRTGDMALSASGAWRQGSAIKTIRADVKRVRWEWLAEVFDNKTFRVPGEGAARIEAFGATRWQGTVDANGSWDSLAAVGNGRFVWDGKTLAVDSLVAESPAGNLRGHVRWSRQGWEIGGDARHANPEHWHALHLDHWPAGDMNGRFLYKVITGKPNSQSRLTADLATSEWVKWVVDSARVVVEFPAVAQDSFRVEGWRRGGLFTLDGRMDGKGWSGPYTVDHLPLEEWPDGRVTGLRGMLLHAEGRVDSRDGALFVTGALDGAGTTWSAAQFARWTLSDVRGRLLPTPDMDASLVATDGFFVGIHLDSADASLHLGDQRVQFSPVRAAAGDTLFALEGAASWDRQARWTMSCTSAQATSDQFAWTAQPPLVISGDPNGTLFDRVIADDGDAHLEARGRWALPGGFYDFSMRATKLDLARVGMPLDWGMGGAGDGHLLVTGRYGDPSWTFEGRASKPAFAWHAADSLQLSLAGRMHTLDVRRFAYLLDGGVAVGSGRVERTGQAWPDSLTATAVVRWLADAGSWNGDLKLDRMPVDHLGALSKQAEGWHGRLDGALELGGSPPEPHFSASARATDFGWRDYRADRIEATVRYADGVLDVPDTRITMLDVVSTISGRMPVQLALGRLPELPDSPMSWSIDVPRGDLRLLPALVPIVQSARGRFDLTASVTGTPKRPKLLGNGHIRSGIVRPAGREEIVEDVYADLHFDEERITLDTLSARQGRTGRVSGHGFVNMDGLLMRNYHFDLALRDFASSQQGLYALLFDGDFEVIDGPRVQGARLPQVIGDMRVKRGVIEFDFANQSEVQKRAAITEPLYWTYHIHMGATRNLRWRPPDGDIEFNADLDLEQTPDSLLIYGEMHAIRGHYFFLSNRFKVTQADLTFDNQRGVDPTMDIAAQTSLIPSNSEYNRRRAETITATITGRASQPVIALDGPDGWDQREVLRELTYGRFVDGGGSLTADPLQNYVTRQLTNQLSRDLSKFFNDAITQWEVQREQGELLNGQGGLVVTIGGDINPQLSWKYSQRLPGLERSSTIPGTTGLFERDVEVEYRINRFIYVTSELTQPRTVTGLASSASTKTNFNLSLKARWEY
ncbi:MAG: translocation/assembly module TamB domain-containing protein [Candidatus Eisenbacteria bacterium]|uniref:Translocation/assembly module TamB domain-containing protein n=1 Tax=Eiseniibacteriota bacterium TaxID=2212470 RepID=A0A933WA10_UNCEI|nr:translocation/assembly module TamB domain-containing protein [Candidatus Eisenbacteria bacterium]